MAIPIAAIAALASTGGGLIGKLMGASEEERARQDREAALALYSRLDAPTLERIAAEQVGTEDYEAIPSDFGNLQARNRAIQALIEEGQQGGYSLASRAEMDAAMRAAGQDELQRRQAILQQARARGGGGNAAILGQLAAQQAGAERTATQGVQSAASARQRALSSLAQGGGMAGQAEESDFARKARIADSRSAIARFNAAQRAAANMYNAGLAQQAFQNRMNLAGAKSNALLGHAAGLQQSAQRTAGTAYNIGEAVGGGLSDYLDREERMRNRGES